MSTQATIEINYYEVIDVLKILSTLQNNGWSLNDYGKISFLVSDDFDWERFDLEDTEVIYQLIQERLNNRKMIGIALVNKSINSGGLFHFERDRLWILISIDRKCIDNTDITNYSSYIQYLKEILNNVCSINCLDVF